MALPPLHYAQQLRSELRLSGPADMLEVASRLEIGVFEEPLDADGYLLQKGKDVRILINEHLGYEGRKMFTIAHEVGHFYMPHHQAQIYRCFGRDLEAYTRNNEMENEANEFASEFLLPSRELDKYLKHPPNLDIITEVSATYGTSLTATAVKLVQLTYEKMAVLLSEAGEIRWVNRSRTFPYWIPRRQLHEWTYAYDYFAKGTLPPGSQKVLASAWCEGVSKDVELVEESVSFDRLGIVLTLLYVPVNEDEDDVFESSTNGEDSVPCQRLGPRNLTC